MADTQSPLNANRLVRGYPRTIKEDFGIINVEGGFFVDLNLRTMPIISNKTDAATLTKTEHFMLLFKDSKIITYNDTRPVSIHFLPFDLSPLQTVVSIGPKAFYILYENRIFNFLIDYSSHQAVLKSIDANIKQSQL